jgi:hypothetical protein
MAFQSPTIVPGTTSPATDITKLTNDLQVLRATFAGTVDADVPFFGGNLAYSSGNIGIGTSSPGYKLTVTGASPTIVASDTGANATRAYVSATNAQVSYGATYSTSPVPIVFGLGLSSGIPTTEWARFDASGNLLVGTTTTTASNSRSFVFDKTNGRAYVQHDTSNISGDYYHLFYYNGAAIGSITQSGTTAVLYNTTSDQRLKTNIVDAPDAAALIDGIKVRSFDWIADDSHQRYGMVAQELAEVAPEAVHRPADPEQMMAVDYSKLVPMLVKEVQALRARVAVLEAGAA